MTTVRLAQKAVLELIEPMHSLLLNTQPDITLPLPAAVLLGLLLLTLLLWAGSQARIARRHTRDAAAAATEMEAANAALRGHQQEMEESALTLTGVNTLLAQASGRFQELFQGLPVACVCCDGGGRIMEWNRAWSQLYGLDSPLGQKLTALTDAPLLAEAIDAAQAGDACEGLEWTYTQADGTDVQVYSSLFPLRAADGSVSGVIAADVDISAQHQAEIALRQSEERLHALYNTTSRQELSFEQKTEALLDMGREQFGLEIGVVARVTGETYEVLHALSPGNAVPVGTKMSTCGTYCAEALALADVVSFEEAGATERRSDLPYRTLGLEAYLGTPIRVGADIWGMLCFAGRQPHPRLFTSGDRELVRLMAQWVGGELARREAEEAVQASESRFREAIAAMSEGLIVMDASGVIRLWNDSAESILGVTRGHVGGWRPPRPDFAAVREDGTSFPEGSYPLIASLRRGEVQQGVVMGLPVGSGAMRWVSVSSRPLAASEGTAPGGVVATFADITDRRRDEAQICVQMAQIKEYTSVLETQKTQMEAVNAELEALALRDGLTGLGNRRAFEQRMALELSRAARYGHSLSLVMLDVDCFKEYNDTFGHVDGDEVLRILADALTDKSRETDFFARYGGEEFAIILPHTDGEGTLVVAERLRRRLEKKLWPHRAVTASFGAATLSPVMTDGHDLVRAADAALYAAKNAGRNRVQHAHSLPESAATLAA